MLCFVCLINTNSGLVWFHLQMWNQLILRQYTACWAVFFHQDSQVTPVTKNWWARTVRALDRETRSLAECFGICQGECTPRFSVAVMLSVLGGLDPFKSYDKLWQYSAHIHNTLAGTVRWWNEEHSAFICSNSMCFICRRDIQLSALSGLNQWLVFYINRFGWTHMQSKKIFIYRQEMHKLFNK